LPLRADHLLVTSNVASLRPVPGARTAALPRSRTAILAGALALAFAVRLVLVWQRATPNYFPDEYLYAALGRSLGALHSPSVRGHAAHFPALLQPFVTAAAWRLGGVETGYRIVQAIGAAAFTLAAVPAFLLARRLGLARGVALGVGALALVVPDGLYAGLVVAEPLAYPLVLGAVAAAVAALARPSRRSQLLFLVLAALAAFARVQFAVLPLCFVAVVVLLGLRERGVRRVVREQRFPLVAIGIACACVVAAAATRGLGYYAAARHLHVAPAAVGANATVLLYAGGWVLAPGAVLGLAFALWRPRSRTELAFAATTLVLGAALLLETMLWGDTTMVQERYLFYVLPLGAMCFGLYASRGWPARRAHALLALVLVVLAARVPLSGYARPGADDHSPFLLAVQHLEPSLGNAGAATLVASLATVLALAAAAVAWRPRVATPLLLGLAVAGCGAALAGATAFDGANSLSVLHRYLPADRSWIDHAGVGDVTLVTAYGGRPVDAEEQLFWNRSVRRVAVLPGGSPPDRLGAQRLLWDRNGVLVAHGRPLRGPLAVDGYAGTIVLRGARVVAAAPHFRLWQPAGVARLALYVPGRYFDGYLGRSGAITLWPAGRRLAGWLELDVQPLAGAKLALRLGDRVVHGGHVRFAVCSSKRWALPFQAPAQQLVEGRPVSGRMSLPRYVADAAACQYTRVT
jgi:hypothetical protein